ncbi:MAG: hypothetical protein ABEK04_03495 [Candidatus Nanohalobium sp.]
MALVVISLIASGCASGGNTDSGGESTTGTNPIQVTKFNAFPNPAPANNQVTFTLELKNTGSVTATNVIAKLWNPPFASKSTDDRTWRDASKGQILGDNQEWERRFDFGELRGAQEGVETFAKPKTLRLTAPNLGSGQSFPYNFHAKYFYKYSTEGSTTITAMGNNQYRQSGASKSRSVQISHNSAPVTLEGQILSGNPVVFYDSDRSQGHKDVQFCVVVKNQGGGTVLSRSASHETRYVVSSATKNKVELTVEALGSTELKAKDGNQGTFATSKTVTVTLISGDQVRKCFTMRLEPLTTTAQKEIGPINVKADYAYVEDTSTTVTVNGR